MASQATSTQTTESIIGCTRFSRTPWSINGVDMEDIDKKLTKVAHCIKNHIMRLLVSNFNGQNHDLFLMSDLSERFDVSLKSISNSFDLLESLGVFLLFRMGNKGTLVFMNTSENQITVNGLNSGSLKFELVRPQNYRFESSSLLENSDNILHIKSKTIGSKVPLYGKLSSSIPEAKFHNYGKLSSTTIGSKVLQVPEAKFHNQEVKSIDNTIVSGVSIDPLLDHYLDQPPTPLTPQGDLEPTPELMKKVKSEIGHEPKRTMDDFKKIRWELGESPPSDLDLNINNKNHFKNILEDKEPEKPKPLYQTLTPDEISDLFSSNPLPAKLSDIPNLPSPEPREPVNMTRIVSAKDQGIEPGLSKDFINQVLGTSLKVVDSLIPADTKEPVNERLSEKKEHIGYDKLNDLLEMVKPISNYFNINFFKQITDRFGYHVTLKATEGFVSVMEEDPTQIKAHQKYLLSLLEQKAEDFKPVITSVKPIVKNDGIENLRQWVRDRVKMGFAESQAEEIILDFTLRPFFETIYRGNPVYIDFEKNIKDIKLLVDFSDLAKFLNRFQVFSKSWPHVSASVIAGFLEYFEGLEG
jgi:hypothetical protein